MLADAIRYGEHQQDTIHFPSGVLSTLPAGSNNNVGHYTQTLVSPDQPKTVWNVAFNDANGTRPDRPNGGMYVSQVDVHKTVTVSGPTETLVQEYLGNAEGGAAGLPFLTCSNVGKGVNNQTPLIGTYKRVATSSEPVAYDPNQVTSKTNRSNPSPGQPCHTLPAKTEAPMLVYAIQEGATRENIHAGPQGKAYQEDIAYTLESRATTQYVSTSRVRRLMPIETERLMGWADEWTKYGINEKGQQYELADGPRYRICGNGWGAPVVTWIAQRIKEIDQLLHGSEG